MRGGFESVFFFYTFRADLFQRDRAETEKGRYCHDIGTISLFPVLRCFDTVFQRPYRNFSIALKVVFSLSDRYKIFTSNWLWLSFVKM